MKAHHHSHSIKLNLILAGLLASSFTHGATVQFGDPSTNLTGTLFINEAATGGTDTTRHDGAGWKVLDLNGEVFNYGSGQPGTITISGFGFANSANLPNNDATSIDMRFDYLGADGILDTADDVTIGTITDITWVHTGAGLYYIDFGAESISAAIDGVGDRFVIWARVHDKDSALQESINMKSDANGTKVTVSGSYEPTTATKTWAGYTIDPNGYTDTENFLGWLYVGPDGTNAWIWCVNLAKYIYLPQDFVTASGGWSYMLKN